MSGPRGTYQYASDDGATYAVRMDVSNATAVGNVVATDEPDLPRNYHPRYVLATHPTTGNQRQLVVGDPQNALWLGSDESITIESFATSPSAQVAHAVLSRIGERRLNR